MATTPTPVSDPRNAHISTGKRDVALTTTGVQPPTALYLQPEDSLIFGYFSPVFGTANPVSVLMRWLRPDGEIVTIRKVFIGPGGNATFTFTLGEGFLLSAVITNNLVAPLDPGTIFCTLTLVRDTPETGVSHAVLISDYMTVAHAPAWPYGRQIFPQEGPGRVRTIVGTAPGAGNEISESVPVGVRWQLLSFRAQLNTSAVVANRKPDLVIDDSSNVLFKGGGGTSIPGSNTGTTTWCNTGYQGLSVANDDQMGPLPQLFLPSGYRIRTQTLSIDAGDNWLAPKYLVQEWIAS